MPPTVMKSFRPGCGSATAATERLTMAAWVALATLVFTCHQAIAAPQPALASSSANAASGASGTSTGSGRVVRTKYGNLRGITLPGLALSPGSRRSGNVEAFLGIPYAAPPVGSLRYLPPASPGPWTGIRLAQSLPPACPQQFPNLSNRTASLQTMPRARYYQLRRMQILLANQSEDCLYLNIYSPSEGMSSNPGGSPGNGPSVLPVIVLIHGESYSWGAGHLMDGSLLAAKSRMVVVTLNYRLGILGFLQTAASPTPGQARGKSKSAIPTQGNYGLLDIMAALLWLKDNVAGFGGDSSRITLSGHGTGAALVNLLMISPLASSLFQRAVMMSGSALSPWAMNHAPGALKSEVARQLECGPLPAPEPLADIGECLRKKPLEALLAVRLADAPRFLPTFAPFVDGAGAVALDPLHAMQTASEGFPRIPLVAGVVSVESYRDTSDADLRNGISEERRDRTLRTFIRNFYQYHLNEIYYVLRNEYTDWDRPSAMDPLSMRDSMTSALSDALVVAPLMHVVHLHAQRSGNPSGTFFYHYQGPVIGVHDPAHDPSDVSEYSRLGSVTGEELEALQLDATVNGVSFTSSDPAVIESLNSTHSPTVNVTGDPASNANIPALLQFVMAFASTGDPNLEIGSKGELMPRSKLRWEPFNLHSQYYLVFGGQQHAHLKSHYRGHHIAVWLQLIPQLHQPGGVAMSGESGQHHEFAAAAALPSDQFYEGIVRSNGTGIAPFASTLPPAVECASSNNLIGRSNHTLLAINGTSSGYGDPNVMASEPGASLVLNAGSANGTSSGRWSVFWTNQAALSITLVVGTFFLVINLLLFAAIYRRNRCHTRDRSGRDAGASADKQRSSAERTTESIESVTDLRQFASNCPQHHQSARTVGAQQRGNSVDGSIRQPLFGSTTSDLTLRTFELVDGVRNSPSYFLPAPTHLHTFMMGDETSKSATLPGIRRTGSNVAVPHTSTTANAALSSIAAGVPPMAPSAPSTQEITV